MSNEHEKWDAQPAAPSIATDSAKSPMDQLRSDLIAVANERDRLKNEVDLLSEHFRGAQERIAALDQDRKRLDWLDNNMIYHGGAKGGTYSFKTPADVEMGMLRDAIDTAMNAEGGK